MMNAGNFWEQMPDGSLYFNSGRMNAAADYQDRLPALQAEYKRQQEDAKRQAEKDRWDNSLLGKVTNFGKAIATPIVNSTTDLFSGGAASLSDLFGTMSNNKIGDSQAYENYEKAAMERFGAEDEKDLANKRLGSALETAATFIPAGAAAKGASLMSKVGRGATAGAVSGGMYGAGDAISQGQGLPEVLSSAGSNAVMGGGIGALFPLAGRGLQAIKNQGAQRIAQKAGQEGMPAVDQTRRALYSNGVRQVASKHPVMATAGVVGGLYGGNKLYGSLAGSDQQYADYPNYTQPNVYMPNFDEMSDEELYNLAYGGY